MKSDRHHLRPWRLLLAAACVGCLMVASACSTKATDSESGSGADGALKTDFGVSDTTITLGALSDLSGPFATLGNAVTRGAQLYFGDLNKGDKICGRAVELDVQDHALDVQKAVSLYADMSPQVLGFAQLVGSSVTAALKQNIINDQMFTVPVSWASSILDNPNNMIVGSTYDIEMINGISYLLDQGLIAKGDKIGHIYLEGEMGENGYLGSQYAAQELGLSVVGQKITPTASDVTSQVTALKNEGVSAILLTTTPTQAASAAAVDAGTGLNVPLLGDNPVFAPQLLDTAAGPALSDLLYVVSSWEPYSGESAGATAAREAYSAAYPDETPLAGVTWGYGAAAAYSEVLQRACDNNDLTRAGVQEAFRETTAVDTKGILPPLDYSALGDPPTRETIVMRPDASAQGGLIVAPDFSTSPTAESYDAPQSQ